MGFELISVIVSAMTERRIHILAGPNGAGKTTSGDEPLIIDCGVNP
jgi:ABC-type branched-subunit amino acid transport system ATPase component